MDNYRLVKKVTLHISIKRSRLELLVYMIRLYGLKTGLYSQLKRSDLTTVQKLGKLSPPSVRD